MPRTWSAPAKVVLGVAGAGMVGATAVFLAALVLHVAPANALSERYQGQVDRVVYPEFEQNWRLFAPNPLQQNLGLDARVQTISAEQRIRTGDWVDLTGRDLAAIRHSPVPGHLAQNQLRRAWEFYDSTHPADGTGQADERGRLAEEYLKRVALQRIGPAPGGERVLQVQVRLRTAPIAPPQWSSAAPEPDVPDRVLPWWPVDETDRQGLG
ncbi:DUF5819 family protein [Kitasatospora sp. McL0602]|uniref:DUF5819 family protein n=1 Tax=Kitasatospora sp. McL0602 TaxID=3439530 RepID=UPI003F894F66